MTEEVYKQYVSMGRGDRFPGYTREGMLAIDRYHEELSEHITEGFRDCERLPVIERYKELPLGTIYESTHGKYKIVTYKGKKHWERMIDNQ